MIKILDLDKIFDKYISGYVYANIGKIKPEEIEDNMPVLYEKFGNEKLKELDGKTPNEYYKSFAVKDLLECLKAHVEQGVSVSDFLCETITSKKANMPYLCQELKKENGEEYTLYLMNMLNDLGCESFYDRLLEFVVLDYGESIEELATELLKKGANTVKEKILSSFNEVAEGKKKCLLEVLSCADKDDKIFDLLISEFTKHQNEIPLYCSYLVKYGDERALPFLMRVIEDDKIKYADFEEVRFSIEALGGEYNKERDFKNDSTYKKITGEKAEKGIENSD